jgi:hypothetical protein
MTGLLQRLTLARRFAKRVYDTHKLALRASVPAVLRASGVRAPVPPARPALNPAQPPRRLRARGQAADDAARLEATRDLGVELSETNEAEVNALEPAPEADAELEAQVVLEGDAEPESNARSFEDIQPANPIADVPRTQPATPAPTSAPESASSAAVAPQSRSDRLRNLEGDPASQPARAQRDESASSTPNVDSPGDGNAAMPVAATTNDAAPRAESSPVDVRPDQPSVVQPGSSVERSQVPETAGDARDAGLEQTHASPSALGSPGDLEALARSLTRTLANIEPSLRDAPTDAPALRAAPPLETDATRREARTPTPPSAANVQSPVPSEGSKPEVTTAATPGLGAASQSVDEAGSASALDIESGNERQGDAAMAKVPPTASTSVELRLGQSVLSQPALAALETAPDDALTRATTARPQETVNPPAPLEPVPSPAEVSRGPLTLARALAALRADDSTPDETEPAVDSTPAVGLTGDLSGTTTQIRTASALSSHTQSQEARATSGLTPTNAPVIPDTLPAASVSAERAAADAELLASAGFNDTTAEARTVPPEQPSLSEPSSVTDSTSRAPVTPQARRAPEALIPEVIAPDRAPTALANPAADSSPGDLTLSAPVASSPAAPVLSDEAAPAAQPSSSSPAATPDQAPTRNAPSVDARGRTVEVYEAKRPRNMPQRPTPKPTPEPAPEPAAPAAPARSHVDALRALNATYELGLNLPEGERAAESASRVSQPDSAPPAPQARSLSDWARALQRTYNPSFAADEAPADAPQQPVESAPTAQAPEAEPSAPEDTAKLQAAPAPAARTLRDWARALQNTYNPPEPQTQRPAASTTLNPADAPARATSSAGDRADSSTQGRATRTFVPPRAPSNSPQTDTASSNRTGLPARPVSPATQTASPGRSSSDSASSLEPSQSAVQPPPAPERIELSGSARRFLQPLVGVDPADVPVLTGEAVRDFTREQRADAAALEGAVLLPEATNLESPETLGLLAHELVHVAAERQARRFVAPNAEPLSGSSAREGASVPVLGGDAAWRSEEERAQRAEARVARLAREGLVSDQPSIAQNPAAALEARWGGLPAPWQPLPDLPSVPTSPATAPTGAQSSAPGVVSLVGAGLDSGAWGGAATSSAPSAGVAGASPATATNSSFGAQFAQSERDGAEETGGEQGSQEQDIGALAKQVYAVLKRRLQNERNRNGGW